MLEDLHKRDLTSLLTSEGLERANARMALIADDVAILTVMELKEKLEAVFEGGDRATMFCYLQAVRRLAHERKPRAPASPGEDMFGGVPPVLFPVYEEFSEALCREEDRLVLAELVED